MANTLLEIPEFNKRAFNNVWNHTVQQEVKRLGDSVTVDSFDGKEKIYTDIAQVSWSERLGRLTNSTPTEVQGNKRKMSKRDFKCQVIFDRIDKNFLADLGRPDSEVLAEMKMSWAREVDAFICDAGSDTVYGGVEPYNTAIDLPSTQKVDVNHVEAGGTPANVGLTPQKIIRAKKILAENDIFIEAEESVLVIAPQEEEDLMAYVQASPNDVWATMISDWLKNKSSKLFGFTVKCSNQINHNASTDISTCLAYSKRRGIFVSPDAMTTSIDVRADLDHAVMVSAYSDFGAMRRYEEAVVEIPCDRSPA